VRAPVLTRDEFLELAANNDLHSMAVEIFIRMEVDELDLMLAEMTLNPDEERWDGARWDDV
jgi:hypothetical protein